jgi:hypothetical protein
LTHLTTVTHLGPNAWQVTCLCGWTDQKSKKASVVAAGEAHWMAAQEGKS